ncbi:MAG: FecR family protein [Bacteroidales bacterium]
MKEKSYNINRKYILSYLGGKHSPEGKRLLNRWFIKKEKSFSAFESFSSDELNNISTRIKSGIEARIRSKETGSKTMCLKLTRSESRLPVKWFYMAASIALFSIIGTFIYLHLHKDLEILSEENLSFYQVRHVPHGKKLKLELTDGSVIFLNSGSEFRFPEKFNSESREVYLIKGEAYFEIAEMPHKPFIVHSPGLKTTVIGTSFNIMAFDNEPDVFITVASGKVQVEVANAPPGKPGMSANLSANEQAIVSRTGSDIKTNIISAMDFLAWKDNILRFDNHSLAEISVILERWFNVKIRFENDELRNCYFIGIHENPKLNNILDAISYSTGMQWEMKDGEVLLKGKRCSP